MKNEHFPGRTSPHKGCWSLAVNHKGVDVMQRPSDDLQTLGTLYTGTNGAGVFPGEDPRCGSRRLARSRLLRKARIRSPSACSATRTASRSGDQIANAQRPARFSRRRQCRRGSDRACDDYRRRNGGAEGIRTPDPKTASLVLSQLSYSPTRRITLPGGAEGCQGWCRGLVLVPGAGFEPARPYGHGVLSATCIASSTTPAPITEGPASDDCTPIPPSVFQQAARGRVRATGGTAPLSRVSARDREPSGNSRSSEAVRSTHSSRSEASTVVICLLFTARR